MVFELNLYELALESNDLFSNDAKTREIDISPMVTDCYKWPHN